MPKETCSRSGLNFQETSTSCYDQLLARFDEDRMIHLKISLSRNSFSHSLRFGGVNDFENFSTNFFNNNNFAYNINHHFGRKRIYI